MTAEALHTFIIRELGRLNQRINELEAKGTEARRAETLQDGSVHDGPVAESDLPIIPSETSNE